MLVGKSCDDVDILPVWLGNVVDCYVPVGTVEFTADTDAT